MSRRRDLLCTVGLGLTACSASLGPVRYQAFRDAPPSEKALEEYAIACPIPFGGPKRPGARLNPDANPFARCLYKGQAIPWEVVGVFRTPSDAADRWPRYREVIRDQARRLRCRGLALLDTPMPIIDDEPIGGLCVAGERPITWEADLPDPPEGKKKKKKSPEP